MLKVFFKFIYRGGFTHVTRFPPSWRRIAPAPLIQSASPLRMPSWQTSWTLRSLSHPSLHPLTTLLSTPAAQRRTLKGTSVVLPCMGITSYNSKYHRCPFVGSCAWFYHYSITYNGSMESPVPLYPTDCPPPYEAVMGQRIASQVSMCV